MTAHGHVRGHATIWVYADTLEPVTDARPCPRCGMLPNDDGTDPCLGHIPPHPEHGGCTSACCGHGVKEGYILYEDDHTETIPNEEMS